jgi:hypothetical protein
MAETDKMLLDLPTVSTTLGPEWATMLNTLLELVDEHDHSTDKGAKVTPAGILINAALDFVNQQVQNAASLGMQDKSVADTAHVGSLQRIGGNLWWITPAGASVQLTSGSAVVAVGSGALSTSTPSSWPHTVLTSETATVLLIDCSSARTINLPAASNAMYVYLKDSTSQCQTNNMTVTPDGSDLIDGANANYTIDWDDALVGFISDGVSSWYVM